MGNRKKYFIFVIIAFALIFSACDNDTGDNIFDYVRSSYTINFNSQGGTSVNSQTVFKGQFLHEPDRPTNGERIFVGWFRANGNRWYFDRDPVTATFSLRAHWVDNISQLLSITFDTDEGTLVTPFTGLLQGEFINLASFYTIKEDYDFQGWYNTSDVSQTIIRSVTINNNITLKALWKQKPKHADYQPLNPGDQIRYFVGGAIRGPVNPNWTGREYLSASILGVQVDGPSANSSYSGLPWDDPRQGNIRTLDNTIQEDGRRNISDLVDDDGIMEFFLHSTRDFDGANTGRQRIEIKGSTSYSGDQMVWKAVEDDIITYYWKFRLPGSLVDVRPAGFFHVFQIKATVGGEAGAPLVTFTVTRDNLLFRNTTIGANMDTTEIIEAIPMNRVLDRWLAAEVTIHYRDYGYLYAKLVDLETDTILMQEEKACDLWRRPESRDGGGKWFETQLDTAMNQIMRPKWGLYRALNAQTREASMMFADMLMIARNKATYRFPLSGYNPADAGPIPNRDFAEYPAFENVTAANWQTTTKSSINHAASIVRIFGKENRSTWDTSSNIIGASETARGRIPFWIAVDLGKEIAINEIAIHLNGSGAADRHDSFYVALTNDINAWNELQTNASADASAHLTTLDPLGIHTTSGLYYTGPNPYSSADKWKVLVAVPKIVRGGSFKNWSTDEVYNFNRETFYDDIFDIKFPNGKSVTGRYALLYSDPYYPFYGPRPIGGSSSSNGSIRIYNWLIKSNPLVDIEINDNQDENDEDE